MSARALGGDLGTDAHGLDRAHAEAAIRAPERWSSFSRVTGRISRAPCDLDL